MTTPRPEPMEMGADEIACFLEVGRFTLAEWRAMDAAAQAVAIQAEHAREARLALLIATALSGADGAAHVAGLADPAAAEEAGNLAALRTALGGRKVKASHG